MDKILSHILFLLFLLTLSLTLLIYSKISQPHPPLPSLCTQTNSIIQPGISLLYEKGVLKKDDAESRRLQNRLENPQNEEDRACITRLSYLMEGDVHLKAVPPGVDRFCWDKFPGKHIFEE